jgi:hypothetical protein
MIWRLSHFYQSLYQFDGEKVGFSETGAKYRRM